MPDLLSDYHSPILLSFRNNTSACIQPPITPSISPYQPTNFLHNKVSEVFNTCHFHYSHPECPLQTLRPRPLVRVSNMAASRTKPSMPCKTSTSTTLLLRPWRTLGLRSLLGWRGRSALFLVPGRFLSGLTGFRFARATSPGEYMNPTRRENFVGGLHNRALPALKISLIPH
jgi:hypothetical protein